jgi:hypothetical protein
VEEQSTAVAEELGLAEAVRFQRDLYLYWREALASGGLPLSARGYVTRPALRRMRDALACGGSDSAQNNASERTEGIAPRFLYLRRLLERLGLLRASPGEARLVATERATMARFLAHPLAERLRICARLWVAGAWWPDRLDPSAEPPRLLAPAPPRIALARRRALELLVGHAIGEAIAIPPLLATARGRSRPRPSPLARIARTSADDSEGETLRAALLGPLAWMGFVALETGDGAEPVACHVGIAVHALVAESVPARLTERPGRVVVQPDASLIAYPPLTAPLLLALDTCAEALSLDVVARYRLSRPALARAGEAGWNATEVAARLEALSGGPLPSNVRATLADWERHVARLRLSTGVSVLEARTPELLDALLADRTMREWVERRLTPTAALLAAEHVPRVREWLLRRGELPAWHFAAADRDQGASQDGPTAP